MKRLSQRKSISYSRQNNLRDWLLWMKVSVVVKQMQIIVEELSIPF
jgi:hypothetical protein